MKPQKTQTMVLPFKGLVFITYYVKKKKKKTHTHTYMVMHKFGKVPDAGKD